MNTLFISGFMFFSFLASTVFAQNSTLPLLINTPSSVVQCQPVLISWSGGTPPYTDLRCHEFFFAFLGVCTDLLFTSVMPGGQPSSPALVRLGRQNGTSFTWTVNLTEGTSIFFQIRDNIGELGQTASLTIQNNVDSTCVKTNIAGSSNGTTSVSTGATTSTSGPTSTPATSASSSSSTKVSQGASSTKSGATASATSAAAASHYAPVGTLIAIGAAVLTFAFAL